jgi:hypothetical protein
MIQPLFDPLIPHLIPGVSPPYVAPHITPWGPVPQTGLPITAEDLATLLEAFHQAVAAARQADKAVGHPDCQDPEKVNLEARVAELERRLDAMTPMKCDHLLGEGYTCNNEHDDPSGLCSTHRGTHGGSSVSGLRRERDRLYDQAAADTVAIGKLRARVAELEAQLNTPELYDFSKAAGCPYCGRRPDAAEPLERILQSQNRAGGPTFDKSSRGSPR